MKFAGKRTDLTASDEDEVEAPKQRKSKNGEFQKKGFKLVVCAF